MGAWLLSIAAAVAAPAGPRVLVAVGAPGAPEYGQAFGAWADRWQRAAERAGAAFTRIGDAPRDAADPEDRERLKALLAAESRTEGEAIWLVLIGHGTFDGREAKFNMRGPDVSAAEIAEWLTPFERPLAVIDCTSSSAPFINRLSGPNRIIVTATKSGYELNYARFGDYLSQAIADPAADLDKDEQVSLLEAFLVASKRVAEFYEEEARLATETALIDDNGDGRGTPAAWFRGVRIVERAASGADPDGARARGFHVIRSDREARMPADLRARRDALERAVEALRAERGDRPGDEAYYEKLEPLLAELARLYESLGD
ncbi:MAG: hypothetical protein JXP34_11595 [Planctomycetes bacterium]|nr:hypothetical protein [Planctomycetota bacterium]